jgi:hypothetical protein
MHVLVNGGAGCFGEPDPLRRDMRWSENAPNRRAKTKPAPKAPVFTDEDASSQELAFNTVTARRFCDQHEMSLHTATGRSLP